LSFQEELVYLEMANVCRKLAYISRIAFAMKAPIKLRIKFDIFSVGHKAGWRVWFI
jgi:hypothetical protein